MQEVIKYYTLQKETRPHLILTNDLMKYAEEIIKIKINYAENLNKNGSNHDYN